jgi:hypothetical protein
MVAPVFMALAPLAAKLAEQGLGLIGNAIMAKGKDVVEEKLGVKIEESLETEEGRIKLMQLQNEKERDLQEFVLAKREQELKADQMAYADTASARDMNSRIQESQHADMWAKRAPYILDFVIVLASILMTYLVMSHQIPEANQNMASIALGSLWTLAVTVVNFHRGSSKGSKDSGDALREIAKQRGAQS